MYGLSTYAFFWRISDRSPRPLTLDEMLARTREMGGEVFQICDYPLIETYDDGRTSTPCAPRRPDTASRWSWAPGAYARSTSPPTCASRGVWA